MFCMIKKVLFEYTYESVITAVQNGLLKAIMHWPNEGWSRPLLPGSCVESERRLLNGLVCFVVGGSCVASLGLAGTVQVKGPSTHPANLSKAFLERTHCVVARTPCAFRSTREHGLPVWAAVDLLPSGWHVLPNHYTQGALG